MTRTQLILYYSWFVLRWTVVITAGGALLGGVIFPIVGWIAGTEGDSVSHMLAGVKNLGFLTFIWAPGISIVMAFAHAYKRHQVRSNGETEEI